jgi:hypothetical protein
MRIYTLLKRREELRGQLDELFESADGKPEEERERQIADGREIFSELGTVDAELDEFRATLDQLLHAALCEAEILLKTGKTTQLASLLGAFRDLPQRRADLDEPFLREFRSRLAAHQTTEAGVATNYTGILDEALLGDAPEQGA